MRLHMARCKTFWIVLAFLAAGGGVLRAQQPPPPPAPGPAMPPDAVPPFAAETAPPAAENLPPDSPAPAADMELDTTRKRDPFWPIGYIPPKPVAANPTTGAEGHGKTEPATEKPIPVDWDAARQGLDIRGISLIGRERQSNAAKYLAMIGGKLVEAGDTVSVAYMSRTYRWRVTAISPDGITLTKLDARSE